MQIFKVGQKIKCVYMPPEYGGKLEIGKIYTISRFFGTSWVYVKESDESHHYELRRCFEFFPNVRVERIK